MVFGVWIKIRQNGLILEQHQHNNNTCFHKTDNKYHGCGFQIGTTGNVFCCRNSSAHKYAMGFKYKPEGNVFEMKLDLTQNIGRISYKMDGIDYGNAPTFDTITTNNTDGYRLHVCVFTSIDDNSVEIMENEYRFI